MTVCVHPQDSAQVLDEGLSRLLDRAPSSLSAIADLLKWSEDEGGGQSHLLQVKVTCSAERPRVAVHSRTVLAAAGCFSTLCLFQTLSSELDALSTELTCQRSKVSARLGVQQCLDDVFRVLSVIRASLAFREKQLSDLKQENVQVRPRHSPVTMDTS